MGQSSAKPRTSSDGSGGGNLSPNTASANSGKDDNLAARFKSTFDSAFKSSGTSNSSGSNSSGNNNNSNSNNNNNDTKQSSPSVTDWETAWDESDLSNTSSANASSMNPSLTNMSPSSSLRQKKQSPPYRTAMDRAHSTAGEGSLVGDDDGGDMEEEANRETVVEDKTEENLLSRQADEALLSGKAVKWDTSDIDGTKSLKPTVKHFSLLRVLGKGSFGKVVLVRKKAGIEVGGLFAMKVLRKSHLIKRRQIERTKTERRVLAVANHPFIMKLHFAFQNTEKLYLVLDYCPGGELFFHLCKHRRFPERVARFYAAELLLAIGHLHSIGIIYRDLKPENVLLDAEGHVKLGDFGLAKDEIRHFTKGATSMCGTPEYMAPEVLLQRGHGFCVDYWGLGMLLYEMFTGLPPWYTTDKVKLFKRLKHAALVLPTYIGVDSCSFVRALLEREPSKRLGCKGLESCKSHVFFSSVHWANLEARKLTPPIRPCEGMKAPETRTSPMVGIGNSNNGSRGSLSELKKNDANNESRNSLSEFDEVVGESDVNVELEELREAEKKEFAVKAAALVTTPPVSTPVSKNVALDGRKNDDIVRKQSDASEDDDKSIASDPGFSLSPDTIDTFTANFDPQFTRLAIDTEDSAFPGSSASVTSSQDGEMFTGFTFDELQSMNVGEGAKT